MKFKFTLYTSVLLIGVLAVVDAGNAQSLGASRQQGFFAENDISILRQELTTIRKIQGDVIITLPYPDVPLINSPLVVRPELSSEGVRQVQRLEEFIPSILDQEAPPMRDGASRLAELAQPSIFRVIGFNDAVDAIRALVGQPDAFLSQLSQWSVSDPTRSELCKTTSQSLASSDNARVRDVLDKKPDTSVLSEPDRQLLQAYANACFRQVFSSATIGEPNFMSQLRDRAGLIRIEPSSRDPKNVSYCSAFLVDSTTAVTARHCLYKPSLDETSAQSTNRIRPGGLKFLALNTNFEIGIDFHISELSLLKEDEKSWTKNVAEDFVAITLNQPIHGISAVTVGAEPNPYKYDHIVQVGYYNLFAILSGEKSPLSFETLKASYAFDDSETCTVLRYSGTCIVQTCQSMSQTSGAVLLGIKNNSISIIGTLHGRPKSSIIGANECFPRSVHESVVLSTNISSRAR